MLMTEKLSSMKLSSLRSARLRKTAGGTSGEGKGSGLLRLGPLLLSRMPSLKLAAITSSFCARVKPFWLLRKEDCSSCSGSFRSLMKLALLTLAMAGSFALLLVASGVQRRTMSRSQQGRLSLRARMLSRSISSDSASWMNTSSILRLLITRCTTSIEVFADTEFTDNAPRKRRTLCRWQSFSFSCAPSPIPTARRQACSSPCSLATVALRSSRQRQRKGVLSGEQKQSRKTARKATLSRSSSGTMETTVATTSLRERKTSSCSSSKVSSPTNSRREQLQASHMRAKTSRVNFLCLRLSILAARGRFSMRASHLLPSGLMRPNCRRLASMSQTASRCSSAHTRQPRWAWRRKPCLKTLSLSPLQSEHTARRHRLHWCSRRMNEKSFPHSPHDFSTSRCTHGSHFQKYSEDITASNYTADLLLPSGHQPEGGRHQEGL